MVDVGGGTGEMVMELARSYKNFKYICQDRPQVIDQAKEVTVPHLASFSFYSSMFCQMWHEQNQADVLNGTVQFHGRCLLSLVCARYPNATVEHNFFAPQPIKNAAVFILRFTLHDWSDPHSVQILKHLRDAATPKTKLVIIDAVLPYNCHSTGEWDDVPGGEQPTSPAPLLPNFGVASSDITYIDLLVSLFLPARPGTN